jgi:outer membrane cobalamin receptor
LSAFVLFADAAYAGPLAGRVVDPDGRPVPGATILLIGAASPRTTVTNALGEFMLVSPDAGRFELRVAVPGFRAEPIVVDASAERRHLGDIGVDVSAVTESVVVSAAQVEIPLTQAASSVTVIAGDELVGRQVHTIADALKSVPGMTVVRYGGQGALTSIFPRGGESDYTLVLIDGVPVNTFGGDFDFAQLSTENVERIEVVRGPQSALFGSNAIGSVVRLVTRRGGAPSGSATVEGGSFGSGRAGASASGSRGAWDWGGSAEWLASDGRNGRTTEAGETIENDDYERTTGSIAGGWRGRGGAFVRGDLRLSRDERGFPGPFGSNPVGAYSGIDTISRGINDRLLASMTSVVPVGDRVRMHGQVAHDRLDSDFESPFGPSQLTSRRLGVRWQADASLSEALDFSGGLEYLRERAGSTFITGTSGVIPVKRQVTGYFAEARWRHRERLFLTTGIRLDDIRRDTLEPDPFGFPPRPELPEDAVLSANPKVSVAWFARPDAASFTKLRASAGTGIRPPNGFEIAFTDNPSLKPERSRSLEAGLDQALAGGRGLIEATAFVNSYDDLIIAVGSFQEASRFVTDNISNARSRGLELSGTARGRVNARTPIDLRVRATYTWLDTEILAVDRASGAPPPFEVGQPLLRRPRHQFSAELVASAGRTSVFLQGGGRSRALDVEPTLGTFYPEFFEAPGYHVWTLGGSVRIHHAVEVFARVENLFNRSYEEAFGYPSPSRGGFAGLRIVLDGTRAGRARQDRASESKDAAGR